MFKTAIAAVTLAALASAPAMGQTFPNRTVQIVIPSSPGGGTDATARFVGRKLSEKWGVPVVVENKTGAGGNITGQFVAKSKPDGHTLYLGDSGLASINPLVYKDMGFDPIKDLTSVVLITIAPYVFLTNPNKLPAKTLKEYVEHANAHSGQGNVGGSSIGTPSQLVWALLKKVANAKINYIPYRGTADAVVDLMGGNIQVALASPNTSKPYIDSGQTRAIAVTGTTRSTMLPDVQTVAEVYPDFGDVTSSNMILAPSGVPKDVIAKIYEAVRDVMAAEDSKKFFIDTGYDIPVLPPEKTQLWLDAEIKRNLNLADVAGLKKN